MNGDTLMPTFQELQGNAEYSKMFFAELFLYCYLAFFITCVLNMFIMIIETGFDIAHKTVYMGLPTLVVEHVRLRELLKAAESIRNELVPNGVTSPTVDASNDRGRSAGERSGTIFTRPENLLGSVSQNLSEHFLQGTGQKARVSRDIKGAEVDTGYQGHTSGSWNDDTTECDCLHTCGKIGGLPVSFYTDFSGLTLEEANEHFAELLKELQSKYMLHLEDPNTMDESAT